MNFFDSRWYRLFLTCLSLGKSGHKASWSLVGLSPTGRRKNSNRHLTRLLLENLEERETPATFTWLGTVDGTWSNGLNWVGGNAPTGDGDTLVFPDSASIKNTFNDIQDGFFKSLQINGSGYTMTGNFFTLGEEFQGGIVTPGTISVDNNKTNNTLAFQDDPDDLGGINLGGLRSQRQIFTINPGAELTITSPLVGEEVGLTKDGQGTLIIAGDNSGFGGLISLTEGITRIQHENALGDFSNNPIDELKLTVVSLNAELQLEETLGSGPLEVEEKIRLTGEGTADRGVLYNLAGANAWNGPVEMDANVTIGAVGNSTLTINGVVSDRGPGHDLTKNGAGWITLAPRNTLNGNTYRGSTTVNEGTLVIAHPFALGVGGNTTNATVVSSTSSRSGGLGVEFINESDLLIPEQYLYRDSDTNVPEGFAVPDELLTLNGPGAAGVDVDPTNNNRTFAPPGGTLTSIDATLHNYAGNNSWEQDITFWSNESFLVGQFAFYTSLINLGAEADTNLTINGSINDDLLPDFPNPRPTYALGKTGPGRVILTSQNTYTANVDILEGFLRLRDSNALGLGASLGKEAWWGTSLELEADNIPDSRTSTFDGDGNLLVPSFDLLFPFLNNIWINHTGADGLGALRNISGRNVIEGGVSLQSDAAIWVNPNSRNGGPEFDDFSQLTINSVIDGFGSDLTKVGEGELVLTVDNRYTGETFIDAGWITIQHEDALGNNIGGRTATLQPGTTVRDGAALHLKPLDPAAPLRVTENLFLNGIGAVIDDGLLSQKGAVVSVGGDNVLSGKITLFGDVGIGSEQIAGFPEAELTITGYVTTGTAPTTNALTKFGSKRLIFNGVGDYVGGVDVREGVFQVANNEALGAQDGGLTVQDGASVELTAPPTDKQGGLLTGLVVNNEELTLEGTGNVTVNGSSEVQQITVDGSTGTFFLVYTDPVSGNTATTAPLRFDATAEDIEMALNDLGILSNDGVAGVVEVEQLGQDPSVFTVTFRGVLTGYDFPELEPVFGNPLTNPNPPMVTVITISNGNPADQRIHPLTVLNEDQIWRGDVTLRRSTYGNDPARVIIDVPMDTGLTISGAITDDDPDTPINIDLISPGKVTLSGNSSFGGRLDVRTGILNIQNDGALGSPAQGTVIHNDASLEMQGNLSVAAERLEIRGDGYDTAHNVPTRWVPIGSTGVEDANGQALAGRITGISADPQDPNIIYVSTAGGGAWKTLNGGETWQPLTDFLDEDVTSFSGAIAVSPTRPNVIYLGLGEGGFSDLHYSGGGVYRSEDYGQTWELMFDPNLTAPNNPARFTPNPHDNKNISKIVVQDPNTVLVATSSQGVGSDTSAGAAGIWRGQYDTATGTTTWTNLTAAIPMGRTTPGPIDDATEDLVFPTDGAYTDVWLGQTYIYTGVDINGNNTWANVPAIFFALGSESRFLPPDILGGVYRTTNILSDTPTWFVDELNGAPLRPGSNGRDWDFLGQPNPPPGLPAGPPAWEQGGDGRYTKIATSGLNVYAIRGVKGPTPNAPWEFVDLNWSNDGGITWREVNNVPNFLGIQFLENLVLYARGGTLYAGGNNRLYELTNFTVVNDNQFSVDFREITVDVDGEGPAFDIHSIDEDANNRLLVGSGGGIWRLDDPGANLDWTSINGNLANVQFRGFDVHPDDPNIAVGGSWETGVLVWDGTTWLQTRPDNDGAGGIAINPDNPNIVYMSALDDDFLAQIPEVDWNLYQSTDGGLTFPFFVDNVDLSRGFALDQVNTDRVVYSSFNLVFEYLDDENRIIDLNAFSSFVVAEMVGLGAYRGPFFNDPEFLEDPNEGPNSYVPGTIYIANNFGIIDLTKDRGELWVERDDDLDFPLGSPSVIKVDPTNHNHVFVAFDDPEISQRIWESNIAGFGTGGWNPISGDGLPDSPIWDIEYDPRNGDIYIGNDLGVYVTKDGGANWSRVGVGLPNVQARELVLNQSLNTLTVATFGRSAFVIQLDDPKANAGAVRVLSGNATWGGDVVITGDSTITTEGTQLIQNGISEAQLTIAGEVIFAPAAPLQAEELDLVKKGGGRLILTGDNSELIGDLIIEEGVLAARGEKSLGPDSDPGNGLGKTIVSGPDGSLAALELESDVTTAKVLELWGGGFAVNNHNTGALRNISNFNTYNGPITIHERADNPLASQSNILVSVEGHIVELTPTGTVVADVIVPTAEMNARPRDLVIDQLGNAQIFNGTFDPTLATYDPATGELSETTFPGWSTDNDIRYGGIGTFEEYIFLTDMDTPGDTESGIIRFDTTDSSFVRFADGTDYTDLTVGLDGILYALHAGNFLDKFDPMSMTPMGTVTLAQNVNGIAVNANGEIFASARDINELFHFDTNGVLVNQISTGMNAASDIDLSSDGTIIAAAGEVFLTTESFAGSTTVPIPIPQVTGQVFVAFGSVAERTNATIGVNSGSQLTLTNTLTTGPNITGGSDLVKELTGELVLSDENAHFGITTVEQGILEIRHEDALGTPNADDGTEVINGAQLQISGNITVTEEGLRLSGTGIEGTGALVNVGGVNTWDGDLNLARDNATDPVVVADFRVSISSLLNDLSDSLTITGTIGEDVPDMGINKIGPGVLVFNNADSLDAPNSYTGLTSVLEGTLQIHQETSLGSTENGTLVAREATLELDGSAQDLNFGTEMLQLNGLGVAEIQRLSVVGTDGAFFLTFGNDSTNALAFSASAGTIQTELNNLPSIRDVGGFVTVIDYFGDFLITFGGTLASGNQEQITKTELAPEVTVTVTTEREGGQGALINRAGNNTWAGGVVLEENASINVVGTTELVVNGNVQGSSEVQQVLIPATVQTFTLEFRGEVTPPLSRNATAAEVQQELNAFQGISGTGGFVTVQKTLGAFTIIFGGTLRQTNVPQLITANPLTVVNTLQDGINVPPGDLTKIGTGTLRFPNANSYTGETIVSEGALLIENSESLGIVKPSASPEVQRVRFTQTGVIPPGEYVNVGPAPLRDGGVPPNTTPNQQVNGAIHTVLAHPTNPNILYIGAVNGGIWMTSNALDPNPTWVPQTDELDSLSMGAMAFDLTDPTSSTLVAGTARYSSFGGAGGSRGHVYRTTDGGQTWVNPGSAGIEGENISGIAARGDTIVVSSSQGGGGIFRSVDGGATFFPITFGGLNLGDNVTDLVLDESASSGERLYAGVEDKGIFRSDDFGLSWTLISATNTTLDTLITNTDIDGDFDNDNNNIEMSVHPTTGRLFVAVLNNSQPVGIFYSDNAETGSPGWIQMDVPVLPIGTGQQITGVTGNGASPIEITSAGHGLDPDETNWVLITGVGGVPEANGQFRVTVIDADTFSLDGTTAAPGTTYTLNTGTWTRIAGPNPSSKNFDTESGAQGRIHFSIVVDPSDENILYVGGDRQEDPFPNSIGATGFTGAIFRGDVTIAPDPTVAPSPQWDAITDNGTGNGTGPHADSREMTFDALGNLIEVDDGGVFRRTDPQSNTGDWFSLNGFGLSVVEFHDIAYNTVTNTVLGGSQDNGSQLQLMEGNPTFTMFQGGDGGDILVDTQTLAASNQVIVYASSQNLSGFRRYTIDSTNTIINDTAVGLVPIDTAPAIEGQFDTPLALNRVDPQRLLLGGENGLYESTDQGDTIRLITVPSFGGPVPIITPDAVGSFTGGTFSVDAIDYGGFLNGAPNPDVAYVGDQFGNIWVRAGTGLGFVQTTPGFFVGGFISTILDIRMDPDNYNRAFAIDENQVLVTTDAGTTWADISGNLALVGAEGIRTIEYVSGAHPAIVVGTNTGTFASYTTSLGTWFEIGANLPNVPVFELEYDPLDDVLLVGTMGRGAWLLPDMDDVLDPTPRPVGPLTFELSFRGDSTGNLVVDLSDPTDMTQALIIENALNQLPSIQNAPGSVSVVLRMDAFDVTFDGGVLADQNVPPIEVNIVTPMVDPTVSTLRQGPTIISEIQTVQAIGNDTFTLEFKGETTTSLRRTSTAQNVEDVLNALDSINGSVTVTDVFNGVTGFWRIEFGGDLEGIDQPTLAVRESGPGTTVLFETLQDGPRGTRVEEGASLQILRSANDIEILFEELTLNGSGTDGSGALKSLADGGVDLITIDSRIILESDTTIGAEAGSYMVLDLPIVQTGGDFGITKVGAGGVEYRGDEPNEYLGLTQVNEGLLFLNKTIGIDPTLGVAIQSDLIVGDDATGDATVALGMPHQIPDTANVTVNSDGTFDLDDLEEVITDLTILGGQGTTGSGATGKLTIDDLQMFGGLFTLGASGSELVLGGNITGGSDAVGEGRITGDGSLNLQDATRTATITTGKLAIDAEVVSAVAINDIAIVKDGPGTLTIDAPNGSVSRIITVDEGGLEVNGLVTSVLLNGGTLSGDGEVGVVTSLNQNSSVNPGDNDSITPFGSLTVGLLEFGDADGNPMTQDSTDTFFVDLDDHTSPGTGYDQLISTGTVSLNGAFLQGTASDNVDVGQTFTIIDAPPGMLNGTFAVPNPVFLGGKKFDIDYDYVNGDVILVAMEREVTLSGSSSPNPSVYSEQFEFTITATPEPGAGPVPSSDDVTLAFRDVTNPTPALHTITLPFVSAGGNVKQVVYDPQTFLGALPPGQYELVVTYNDNSDFLPILDPSSTFPIPHTINPAPVEVAVQQTTNPSVFGQDVEVTLDISAALTGTQLASFAEPTGDLTLFVDGNQVGVDTISVGLATFTIPSSVLNSVGTFDVTVSYPGDANYAATPTPIATTPPYSQEVVKAATSLQLSADPLNFSVVGEEVKFEAVVTIVAPGDGTPTGDVLFFDGQFQIGSQPLLETSPGVFSASFATSNLAVGPHDISAVYQGTDNFEMSSDSLDQPYTITKRGVTVDIVSLADPMAVGDPAPIIFGAQPTYRVTVTSDGVLSNPPTGSVMFQVGLQTSTVPLNSMGRASFTPQLLHATEGGTPHVIEATYLGDGNYQMQQVSLNQAVDRADTRTTLSPPSNNNVSAGEEIVFNVQVRRNDLNSTVMPQPSGDVKLIFTPQSGGQPEERTASLPPNSSTVTFMISDLPAGTYNVVAEYQGDADLNYDMSNSSLPGPIVTITPGATITTVTSNKGSTVFGEPLELTARVTPSDQDVTLDPQGVVTFEITTPLGVQTFDRAVVNREAVLNINDLPVGVYDANMDVRAIYNDVDPTNPNHNPSFTTSTGFLGNEVNIRQATTTTIMDPSGPFDGAFGDILFTAIVTSDSPSEVSPMNGDGTVTFTIVDVFGIDPVRTSNPVPFTFNATESRWEAVLPPEEVGIGTFRVSAEYTGSTNFVGSTSTSRTRQVLAVNTMTTLTADPNPTTFGAVNVTATVVPDIGTGSPTGTVTFTIVDSDGQTLMPLPQVTLGANDNGVAVLPANLLEVGTYTITASYEDDSDPDNYGPSTSNTLTNFVVNPASTTTTLNSTANPGIIGQPVVTATVAGVGTSGVIPTGTVTFTIDGMNPTVVGVNATTGVATLPTPSEFSTVGTYEIRATYTPTVGSNFSASTGIDPNTSEMFLVQVITKASVSFDYTVEDPVTGQPVNPVAGQDFVLAIDVTTNSQGVGLPGGTIDVDFAGVSYTNVPVNAGQAEIPVSGVIALDAGTYPLEIVDYTGDSNFAGQMNVNLADVVVAEANVQVSIAPVATVTFDADVTFDVTVTAANPGSGIPEGTVTLLMGGQPIAPAQSLVNGQVSFIVSGLNAGVNQQVEAMYSGATDPNFLDGSGFALFTINQAGSTTDLQTPVPSMVEFGQEVTLTADVTSSVSLAGTQVRFDFTPQITQITPIFANFNSTTGDFSVTVDNIPVSETPYQVTATFLGTNNIASSSDPVSETLTIIKPTPTITLTSVGTGVFGQTGLINVTVLDGSTAVQEGDVQFIISPVGLPTETETVTFANGGWEFPVLDVGLYTIQAQYEGSSNFTASGSPSNQVNLNILAASTTTNVNVPTNLAFGDDPAFTATVTAQPESNEIPTGNVRFDILNQFNQSIASGTKVVNGSGQALINLSEFTFTSGSFPLNVGTYTVRASYEYVSVDNYLPNNNPNVVNFMNSSSMTTNNLTIAAAATSVAFVGLPVGQPTQSFTTESAQFTVAVTSATQASGTPTGSVTLTMDRDLQTPGVDATSTMTLQNGQASFSFANLPEGTYTLTATYNPGTLNFAGDTAQRTGAESHTVLFVPTVVLDTPGNPPVNSQFDLDVQLLNEDGSPFDYTGPVTLIVAQAPAGGTISGNLTSTATNGLATFPQLSANRLGEYQFATQINGFPTLAAQTLTIGGDRITPSFSQDGVTANVPFDIGLVLTDETGIPDTNSNAPVSVTVLSSIPAGGRLSGNTTTTLVAGIGTLTNLTVNQAGAYTLLFSSGNLRTVVELVTIIPPGRFIEGLPTMTQPGSYRIVSQTVIPSSSQLGQVRAQFGFQAGPSLYTNSYGQNEIWFLDRFNQWHTMTPDGTIREWNGLPAAAVSVPDDLGQTVAEVDPLAYANPNSLFNAPLAFTAEQYQTLSDLRINYGFRFGASTYQNARGQNEKWFQDRNGLWYTITIEPDLNNPGSQTGVIRVGSPFGAKIADVSPAMWDDLNRLFNAPVQVTDQEAAQLQQVKNQFGFRLGVSTYQNLLGLNEKWFQDRAGAWYTITLEDGEIRRWNGVTRQLDSIDTDPVTPGVQGLIVAQAAWVNLNLLFNPETSETQEQFGFRPGSRLYQNIYGQNEKWFLDWIGDWHTITPDGKIRRWGGIAFDLGQEVTTVSASVWSNPTTIFIIS
ncbi:MAG: Ig-like domain repeat protein [Gemmataceae bacterium]